jgi:hypothetical protein
MEPTERNIRAFDALHRQPVQRVPQHVRDRLPPLEGLRVLLLEGTAATGAELAAEGSLVTLTSTQPPASAELPTVQADPAHLPSELLRARFDLVYLEPGALHGDLDAIAAGLIQTLRPLGWLVVFDRHPADEASGGDYFAEWTIGDLVTAVSQAGLAVKRLEEYPARRDPRVPGEFLLRAEKPQ